MRKLWRWLFAPLTCLALSLHASEPIQIPQWVVDGVLEIETKSYHRPDGSIMYVDQRIGKAGEHSCFQIRSIALRQVHLTGWRDLIQQDTVAAEYAFTVIMRDCYRRTGNWFAAVGVYHAPQDPDEAADYARRVWALRTY